MSETHVHAPATAAPPVPLRVDQSALSAYNALHTGATFFTLPPRHTSSFIGAGAAAALNGLVTNDVTTLAVGRGLYAAALTPKGKLLADVAILRTEPEMFLVETSAAAGAEWFAMVRKYVNPRLAKYQDISNNLSVIGVYGPRSSAILARLGGAAGGGATLTDALTDALNAWTDWTNASWKISGTEIRLVRAPYLGAVPGYLLLASSDASESLAAALANAGAERGNDDVWSIAALESGRPLYGLDMDGSTLPQEANLEDWSAISFEKGCYTGQETVARVHFRGHVNKRLCALRSDTVLPPGTTLHDASGKSVGEVRRSGESPAHGPLAIGMVRREVGDTDTLSATVGDAAVEIHTVNVTQLQGTLVHPQ